MKNKKSNVKKETQNLLRFLYEDENPTRATNAIYVSDGNISDFIAQETGIHADIGTIAVGLSDEQINKFKNDIDGSLHPIQLPKDIESVRPDFPNTIYTTYALEEFKEEIFKIINDIKVIHLPTTPPASPAGTPTPNKFLNYLSAVKSFAKAHQGSLIGAGVGAGITAAGWAAARAYLQRQLKNCGDNEKCKKAINAKIKKLNRMALLSGIGLTALGAAAQPLSTAAVQGVKNIFGDNKTNNETPEYSD